LLLFLALVSKRVTLILAQSDRSFSIITKVAISILKTLTTNGHNVMFVVSKIRIRKTNNSTAELFSQNSISEIFSTNYSTFTKNLSTFKMKLNLALLFSSAFALFGSIHAIVTDDIKDCDGHPGKTKERSLTVSCFKMKDLNNTLTPIPFQSTIFRSTF
jgi:lysyl-tRNA synthetase class II